MIPLQSSHSHNSVLVSVIIPAYNTARYIHRAIESCLRQPHSNISCVHSGERRGLSRPECRNPRGKR
ncbi:MAG: glycosyltransferase [Synergistaceae bacterium]|nr:glycosyltransferase [Synergistaceae bacterium]